MKLLKFKILEMGDFFEAWKIWKEIKYMPNMFRIVQGVFKFVADTHKEQRPMLTHIGLINIEDGTELVNMVDLWAGIGESNPIQRLKHLSERNKEMRRVLEKVYEKKELDEHDLLMVQIAIKMWN
jgi:hypothetical protein